MPATRSGRFRALLLAALIVPLLAVSTEGRSEEMLLYVQGYDGDSAVAGHQGWFDLLGCNYSVSRQSGSLVLEDFQCKRYMDSASPRFYLDCCASYPIATVKLEIYVSLSDPAPSLEVEFSNVTMTSVQTSAPDTSTPPTEKVTLEFEQVVWTSRSFDGLGNIDKEMTQGWDVVAQTPLVLKTAVEEAPQDYE